MRLSTCGRSRRWTTVQYQSRWVETLFKRVFLPVSPIRRLTAPHTTWTPAQSLGGSSTNHPYHKSGSNSSHFGRDSGGLELYAKSGRKLRQEPQVANSPYQSRSFETVFNRVLTRPPRLHTPGAGSQRFVPKPRGVCYAKFPSRRGYRGTSFIRHPHPHRTTIEPWA